MTFGIWNGTEEIPARLSLLVDDVETPARAALMPTGAPTAAEFLTRQSLIGHRGASLDYAEGSRRAMTEAVLRGVDALEMPLSRTSDGVWFGLHDADLLRTSGVAIDPTTITWAELAAYQIAAPAGGDPAFGAQPYMRLEQLLEDYGPSHTLFLDPKYHAGPEWRDEMYGLIESVLPSAQDSVVIKFSGDGTTVADAATARGFPCFGYWYDSQFQADQAKVLAETAAWTILGMEWDAEQATWDALTGLGKPVIAHTAATTTQRDTAIAKGASGIMCSGVRAVQGPPVI